MNWLEYLPFACEVNDIHAQLNPTRVSRVVRVRNLAGIERFVGSMAETGRSFSIGGGRHAMGGQAFGQDTVFLDMRGHCGLSVDRDRGLATIDGGAQWPGISQQLADAQEGDPFRWTFRQKQTGGDRLTIGGSASANIHSRGLTMRPMAEDIEFIRLVKPDGTMVRVDRVCDPELFSLVVGGYGLYGVIAEVGLRLVRRHKLMRKVVVRRSEGLMEAFESRIGEGYEYGDFQFAIDPKSDGFLDEGVFSCYLPVEDGAEIPEGQNDVPKAAWHHLVYLAHHEKAKAFELYADFYRKTDGQVYWSDDHQMTPYIDGYHRKLDRRVKSTCKGSEMITELYVPREKLEVFLAECRKHLKESGASVIYGTIRLIRADEDTYLKWATEDFACIIFNLHVDHSPEGIVMARAQFCGLIDIAQALGGSFYLTYHKWATRNQVMRSYPQMPEFLAKKRQFDPRGLIQSEWFRHMSKLVERTS